jgi:hypothetical protein
LTKEGSQLVHDEIIANVQDLPIKEKVIHYLHTDRFPNESNFDQGNQERVLCNLANAHSSKCQQALPRIRRNTKRAYEANTKTNRKIEFRLGGTEKEIEEVNLK